MANEFNTALKSAAEKIAHYVDNIATMTVETRYVDLDGKTIDLMPPLPRPARRSAWMATAQWCCPRAGMKLARISSIPICSTCTSKTWPRPSTTAPA